MEETQRRLKVIDTLLEEVGRQIGQLTALSDDEDRRIYQAWDHLRAVIDHEASYIREEDAP